MSCYLTIAVLLLGQVGDNDVRTKVPAKPFECAHARSFRFDKTGRKLICVTQRGELLAWNENDEDPTTTVLEKKPGGNIFSRAPISAVLTPGGQDVALFYHDGRAQVWNLSTGTKRQDLVAYRVDLGYSYASPKGDLVACLSYGREATTSAILFWNTRDWTPSGSIETAEKINDFCFSPDGRQLVTCVGHPTDQKDRGFTGIIAWNLASKEETGRIEYDSGFPIRIAMSPNGRWVATGGGDAVPVSANGRRLSGHLRIFDWAEKKFVTEPFALGSDYVRALQFSPDSQSLYSGSFSVPAGGGRYQAEVRAYHSGDWALMWNATLGFGNPHDLTVSPNGKDILVADSDHLQIVDAKDGSVRGPKLKFRFYPEDADVDKVK